MGTSQKSGLWTETFGQIGATLKALQDWGVTVQHTSRIRSDKEYAQRVARFIINGGLEGSIYQKYARHLMGTNFWGPEEWSSIFGVMFSNKQLRKIEYFPWGEDVLTSPCPFTEGKKIRETHFAFLGINKIDGKNFTVSNFGDVFHDYMRKMPNAYKSHDYDPLHHLFCSIAREEARSYLLSDTCDFRWYLMPLRTISIPEFKGYESAKQIPEIPTGYEIPLLVEEVTKHILRIIKGGWNFENAKQGFCKEIQKHPGPFGVKSCSVTHTPKGPYILHHQDDEAEPGLAFSRIPPN